MTISKLSRVFTISALSGFGKCSLTISIPIISACGVEVCPIPVAILSTNTKFDGFQLHNTTDFLPNYINHWKQLSLSADAIYTGFLGSHEQINLVDECLSTFRPNLIIIDPVMADNGLKYKTYTDKMCSSLKKLVSKADITTPNLTEAFILAEKPYDPFCSSPDQINALATQIRSLGAKQVIIKGVEREGKIYNCLLNDSGYFEHSSTLLPFKIFGTGDLFASILTGKLLTNHSIEESIGIASDFISFIMNKSLEYDDYENRGLCFEPYLSLLKNNNQKNI